MDEYRHLVWKAGLWQNVNAPLQPSEQGITQEEVKTKREPNKIFKKPPHHANKNGNRTLGKGF